jgi:serine/threonine protein kinase
LLQQLTTKGRLPFDDENLQTLLKKVKQGQYVIPTYLSQDVKDLIQQMLCMDPEKRITLPLIKKHPWYRRMDKQLSALSNSGMNIPTFEQLKKRKQQQAETSENVTEAVKPKVDEEEDEEVVASVLQDEQDAIKHNLEDEAEKEETNGEVTAIPEEELDPEILTAMEQMGWTEHDKLKEALITQGKNMDTVAYKLLKMRKEQTGSVAVESYHPKMSISATNPLEHEGEDKASLLRKKLVEADSLQEQNDGDSGANGASSASALAKKQWFAFWKKKPNQTEKKKEMNSQFGLHSSKTQEEILKELDRSFRALQIQWQMVDEATIRFKCDYGFHGNERSVEFDLTMTTVPDGGGFFLNFNKVNGETVTARILFDVIQEELQI